MVRFLLLAAAAAIALAGLAVALALGANPAAALVALIAGAGAVLLLRAPREDEPETPPPGAPPSADDTLARLIEAIDDPLLVVDGRRVTMANAAAHALLGEHIVGEDLRTAIRHPAAAPLAEEASDTTIALSGIGAPGRPWLLSSRPIGSASRLLRLVDRSAAQAAERMRVDFVANASHELRTPLAAIIGFIETLEDANGPADAAVRARFLGIMAGEARRMQRLIEDLLALSRIEADRYRAPADVVALAPLAEEVADAIRGGAMTSPEIAIVQAGATLEVAGDRAQLSQLLYNLIGNALKYGPFTGPVTVTIGGATGAMVALAVTDRGEGIAPEHLPRLTERFYRVDTGRSRALGGTGLGLAIVKHIVERHRGRLEIASTPGAGTTVTVLLPEAAAADRL